jgi:hypothetical protein
MLTCMLLTGSLSRFKMPQDPHRCKRSNTSDCRCQSNCTMWNLLTGSCNGEGTIQSQTTHWNHAQDESKSKNFTLTNCILLLQPDGLHKLTRWLCRGRLHNHWAVCAFCAGHSWYTLHVHLDHKAEVYANGGWYWANHYLGSTEYGLLLTHFCLFFCAECLHQTWRYGIQQIGEKVV